MTPLELYRAPRSLLGRLRSRPDCVAAGTLPKAKAQGEAGDDDRDRKSEGGEDRSEEGAGAEGACACEGAGACGA